MVAIEVSPEYGWVIIGAGLGSVVTSFILSADVMGARKTYDVQYPNLYAAPGFHKNADEFNRVQRGHQNFLENIGAYSVMTLIGGLQHPIACAIGSLFFSFGSILYMKGYSDATLDVKTARYKKGAGIKWIGFLCSFYSTASLAYSLITA